MDWLDLLAVQGTLKSLLQHDSSKTSILQPSAFFIVQLLHPKIYIYYFNCSPHISISDGNRVEMRIRQFRSHQKCSTPKINSYLFGKAECTFNKDKISKINNNKNFYHLLNTWASQVVLVVKNLSTSAGDIRDIGSIPGLGRSPGRGHGTYSSILAWRSPWTEGRVSYSPQGHKESDMAF